MKNQLNNTTAKITKKFDAELLNILNDDLRTAKNKTLITRLQAIKGGLMVA